jgi:hypothetical protein
LTFLDAVHLARCRGDAASNAKKKWSAMKIGKHRFPGLVQRVDVAQNAVGQIGHVTCKINKTLKWTTGIKQSGVTVDISRVRIGAFRDQKGHDVAVTEGARIHQRRASYSVARFDIQTGIDQYTGNLCILGHHESRNSANLTRGARIGHFNFILTFLCVQY